MNPPDLINGAFEAAGACACWANVVKIARDRCVKGVYWPVSLIYTIWGLYNLWFYPHLGQRWSFWGAVVMALANGTWVCLAWWYSRAKPDALGA